MNLQDLNRIRQITLIAARHGFGEVAERAGVWRMLGGRKEKVEVSEEARRESTARRFRLFLSELGPTFIKLGQVLSTRADLLPAEFVDELATLQDHVEAIPLAEVQAQIREALGKDVEELFAQVDPEPLAAASIAQVHRAVTLDGEEVVIKVQRPGIAQRIDADLGVLRSLARLLEAVVEETGIYTPSGIVDEFDRAIHEELDFLNEATNIRAFLENHKDRPYLKIPRVYASLSSRTVLTMEFIRGRRSTPPPWRRWTASRWPRTSWRPASASSSTTASSTATPTRGTCSSWRATGWRSWTSASWAGSRAPCRRRW